MGNNRFHFCFCSSIFFWFCLVCLSLVPFFTCVRRTFAFLVPQQPLFLFHCCVWRQRWRQYVIVFIAKTQIIKYLKIKRWMCNAQGQNFTDENGTIGSWTAVVSLDKVFAFHFMRNNFWFLPSFASVFKSFGGQHSREQSNSEAYPPRSMEWFPQPSWQEEGRKLPCGTEKCGQHLLVQCSDTGGITIHVRWYLINPLHLSLWGADNQRCWSQVDPVKPVDSADKQIVMFSC